MSPRLNIHPHSIPPHRAVVCSHDTASTTKPRQKKYIGVEITTGQRGVTRGLLAGLRVRGDGGTVTILPSRTGALLPAAALQQKQNLNVQEPDSTHTVTARD